MTKTQWRECPCPMRMIYYITCERNVRRPRFNMWAPRPATRYQASERKLSLFNYSCGRRMWAALPEVHQRKIALGERVQDGELSADVLLDLRKEPGYRDVYIHHSTMSAELSSYSVGANYAECLSYRMFDKTGECETEQRRQAVLLRHIFGWLPFHPVQIEHAWLTSNVIQIARSVYQDRHLPEGTFDHGGIAILADALEEAGGGNSVFLRHLRAGGEHVRGCWVVDLILGKS